MSTDPPIIITGGSVHIDIPDQIVPNGAKFSKADKKITRIVIYPSGATPTTINFPDGKCSIEVYYENSSGSSSGS